MSAVVKQLIEREILRVEADIRRIEWNICCTTIGDLVNRANLSKQLDRLKSSRYDLTAYLAVHFKESK